MRYTVTIIQAVFEVSLVSVTVGKRHFSSAMVLIMAPLAFISVAIRILSLAYAFSAAVQEISFVPESSIIVENSEALQQVVLLLAFCSGPVG